MTDKAAEAIAARNVELRAFLLRLLDPDDVGGPEEQCRFDEQIARAAIAKAGGAA